MTAVEWFAYNDAQATLDYAEGRSTELVFAVQKMAILQQAKEMEKEQIKKAWIRGWKDSYIEPLEDKYYEQEADQYYNQTFMKGTDL